MGLFNPNYNKPGPGVSKDEPEKKGAALYWELFSRKWRSYFLLNIIYALTCIPAFLFYFLVLVGLSPNTNPAEEASIAGMIAAFMVLFFAGSPFKSGFTYVIRNFVRQEHAWTVADFFSKTKENLGQSLAAFIIDIVVSTCFIVAIRFYFTMSQTNAWMSLLLGIVIFVMIIFAIMQSFTWCMMVTFKLRLKDIYKNAFLLSMATIPVNLLSLVIRIAATGLIFYLNIICYLILLAVFLAALTLLEQMIAYPTIKKFMLAGAENTSAAPEEENDKEETE